MGYVLKAVSNNCGFQRDQIYFGSGMSKTNTYNHVPAINMETGQFVVQNIYRKFKPQLFHFLEVKTVENLMFYNELVMYNMKPEDRGIYSGNVVINSNNNLCPLCLNFTMDFINTGLWD